MAIVISKSKFTLILVSVLTVVIAAFAIGTAVLLQQRSIGGTPSKAATATATPIPTCVSPGANTSAEPKQADPYKATCDLGNVCYTGSDKAEQTKWICQKMADTNQFSGCVDKNNTDPTGKEFRDATYSGSGITTAGKYCKTSLCPSTGGYDYCDASGYGCITSGYNCAGNICVGYAGSNLAMCLGGTTCVSAGANACTITGSPATPTPVPATTAPVSTSTPSTVSCSDPQYAGKVNYFGTNGGGIKIVNCTTQAYTNSCTTQTFKCDNKAGDGTGPTGGAQCSSNPQTGASVSNNIAAGQEGFAALAACNPGSCGSCQSDIKCGTATDGKFVAASASCSTNTPAPTNTPVVVASTHPVFSTTSVVTPITVTNTVACLSSDTSTAVVKLNFGMNVVKGTVIITAKKNGVNTDYYKAISNVSFVTAPDGFKSGSGEALVFSPGGTYSTYYHNDDLNAFTQNATAISIASCAPSEKPVLTLLSQCIDANNPGTAGIAKLTLTKTPPTNSWVDVDTDTNWGNGFYNKNVTGVTNIPVPDGFKGYNGVTGTLSISAGKTYYIRYWDDTVKKHSDTITLSIPVCPTRAPSDTVTPTNTLVPTIPVNTLAPGETAVPSITAGESTNLPNTGAFDEVILPTLIGSIFVAIAVYSGRKISKRKLG